MKPDHGFTVGQRVVYTMHFLRYVGWTTGVPAFGIVRRAGPITVDVQWEGNPHTTAVLPCNLRPEDTKHRELP